MKIQDIIGAPTMNINEKVKMRIKAAKEEQDTLVESTAPSVQTTLEEELAFLDALNK